MTPVRSAADGLSGSVGTLPDLLAGRAHRQPDRTAVETVGGSTVTFAEWDARADRVAGALLARGLPRGGAVLLVFAADEWTEFAIAFCGVLRAGGVAVPCSDRSPAARLEYVAQDSRAVLAVRTRPAERSEVSGVPWATLPDLEAADTDAVEVALRPGDPAQILYTSGTTGSPKGVCASHANLAYGAATHPSRRPLAHSDQFLHAFPIGTNAGQRMLLNALDAHPTAVVLPRFTSGRFVRLIEQRRIGTLFVVPAMAAELVNSKVLAGRDLSSVRLLGCTAAALPPTVAVALADAFPTARIVNYYTSTEAAPAQTTMVFDPRRPEAVGRAVGGALRITDEAGRPVPAGDVGEVWLRAPFPRWYLDQGVPHAEGARSGWVQMNDLGRVDEEGYFHLVDRSQQVIKSGAFKVSTLQVEAAVLEHAAVADAAAVALPHPILGSVVGLALVPKPAAARAALDLAAVRAFLRDRLADHELPAQVVLLRRLPRNQAGKVDKADLPGRFGPRPFPHEGGASPEGTRS